MLAEPPFPTKPPAVGHCGWRSCHAQSLLGHVLTLDLGSNQAGRLRQNQHRWRSRPSASAIWPATSLQRPTGFGSKERIVISAFRGVASPAPEVLAIRFSNLEGTLDQLHLHRGPVRNPPLLRRYCRPAPKPADLVNPILSGLIEPRGASAEQAIYRLSDRSARKMSDRMSPPFAYYGAAVQISTWARVNFPGADRTCLQRDRKARLSSSLSCPTARLTA
jgi:hypothetical protein